jgi:hypothetical protein
MILVTPQDEIANPGIVEAALKQCWELTTGPVALSEYGANLPLLYDCMGAHLDAGRRLFGVFDHTQASGPTERAVLAQFQAKYEQPWRDQDIVIGTSSVHSAILHQKQMIFNAPMFGFKPAVGDYETPEDALRAGACVSWFGTLNITTRAVEQSNTVAILPGVIVATMFCADIIANHDFVVRRQQAYQPYPRRAP